MTVRLNKGSALAALNITPLIDVVFLLLVFFLVTAQFAEESRELRVRLPDATSARPLTETPDVIVIGVDATGQFVVDGRLVSGDELEALLSQALANNPATQSVQILGDGSTALDHVVEVMDRCNRLGIDYTIRTRPRDES